MRKLWLVGLLAPLVSGVADLPTNYVAGKLIQLNDNGAWSWFMDERAVIDDGKLIVGSVRAVGDYRNDRAAGWGNVEVSVCDLASGATQRTVLHRHLQQGETEQRHPRGAIRRGTRRLRCGATMSPTRTCSGWRRAAS